MASLMAVRPNASGRSPFLDPAAYPDDGPVCDAFKAVTGGFLNQLNPNALSTFRFGDIHVSQTVYWGFELHPGLFMMIFDLSPGTCYPGDVDVTPSTVARMAEAMAARPWDSWIKDKYGVSKGLYAQVGEFMGVARDHGLGLALTYEPGQSLGLLF